MTCDRVIIIHEGKIMAEDKIENLSSIIKGGKRIRLEIKGPAEKVAKRLQQIEGIRQVSFEDPHHIVECAPEEDPRPKIMEAVVQSGWILLTMEPIEMSLEDIFLELTTEEEEEANE